MLIRAFQPGQGQYIILRAFSSAVLNNGKINIHQTAAQSKTAQILFHGAWIRRLFPSLLWNTPALLGLEWSMTHRPACSSEGTSITGPQLQPGDRFALPQLTHPSALAPLHTQATWRGPARPGNVTLFQTCQILERSTMNPATRSCFTAVL